MRGFQIQTASHDDIEPCAAADPLQRLGVLTQTEVGRIDDRLATQLFELHEFVDGDVRVEQLAVVEIRERIHAELADHLDADRLAREFPAACAARRDPFAGSVQQDVLVRQSNPERVGRDLAEHRRHQAAVNTDAQ